MLLLASRLVVLVLAWRGALPPRPGARPTAARMSAATPPQPAFDAETAVLLSGFAFEAYNAPSERDARWERGADGCNVAFMSDAFARLCYAGMLEVRLRAVKELPPPTELAQALLSGDFSGRGDPYVLFALNEEASKGPKEGAVGLVRAVDRARSTTQWSRDAPKGTDKGSASWGDEEVFYLYVKDPDAAQLALTVFDEDVLKDDEPLGAASTPLGSLLKFEGAETRRSWSGWVPLTWRPETTQDNTVAVGAVAGALVAGPVGAAAGGLLGSLIKKPVQGEVQLALKYVLEIHTLLMISARFIYDGGHSSHRYSARCTYDLGEVYI